MSAWHFEEFRKRLAIQNAAEISSRYREITKRLNKDFWDLDSEETHCLQVGSYGRHTAIHGVSDLDMVFELPLADLARYQKVEGNGPSQMLQEVRKSLLERYPRTEISGDGQVVVVRFAQGHEKIEVLPAFYNSENQSYTYGNTHGGGKWPECKPRQEIAAFDELNRTSNGNLKRVCKMLRAWRNRHGAPMNGMLIDTLVYRFFKENTHYNDKSYAAYPVLMRDVFGFLAELPVQESWLAPGSNQQVKSRGKFQLKAKQAAETCSKALVEESIEAKEKLWRKVFGGRFLPLQPKAKAAPTVSTEEFIEDRFLVDIKFELSIVCEVLTKDGRLEKSYRWLGSIFPWIRHGRTLRFRVDSCNVPEPFELYWKVRNVGPEAEKRKMIRGQIVRDAGRQEKLEPSVFYGPHFVECYAVKDGVCLALDRIDVPIGHD